MQDKLQQTHKLKKEVDELQYVTSNLFLFGSAITYAVGTTIDPSISGRISMVICLLAGILYVIFKAEGIPVFMCFLVTFILYPYNYIETGAGLPFFDVYFCFVPIVWCIFLRKRKKLSLIMPILDVIVLFVTQWLCFEQHIGQRVVTWQQRLLSYLNGGISLTILTHRVLQFLSAKYEELKAIAYTDSLTKLKNRQSLDIILDAGGKKTNSEDITYVAILDIDYFKHVNDTYGHVAGDRVLQYVASFFLQEESSDFNAYRYGGEEIVVLTYLPLESLKRKLAVIANCIENSKIAYNNTTIQVTISGGISTIVDKNLTKSLEAADAQLYLAKSEGRNRIIYENEIIRKGQKTYKKQGILK